MSFKELRQDNFSNMSIRDAAEKMGISTTALFNYENRRKFPRKSTLKRIQKKCGLTDEDIKNLYLDYYFH